MNKDNAVMRLQYLLDEQQSLNEEMKDLLHRGYRDYERYNQIIHRLRNVAFGVNRCRMCLFGYAVRVRRQHETNS